MLPSEPVIKSAQDMRESETSSEQQECLPTPSDDHRHGADTAVAKLPGSWPRKPNPRKVVGTTRSSSRSGPSSTARVFLEVACRAMVCSEFGGSRMGNPLPSRGL